MALFFRKQQQLLDLLHEYLGTVDTAQARFGEAIQKFLEARQCCEDFDYYVKEAHKAESRGDDIYDKISRIMFEKALVPEFRADILDLLHMLDEIPNQFDRVLHAIHTQRIKIPEFLANDYRELIAVSFQACDSAKASVGFLFDTSVNMSKVMAATENFEGHGDYIEQKIIGMIFASTDIEPFDKILLRDLTLLLGDIADHAKSVSKFMYILDIKRRV